MRRAGNFVTDIAVACGCQLSRHCEALQNKIENLEEVFTTSQVQEHHHTSNLPARPTTGSDWGLLGATKDASMPGPRRGATMVDEAADALLRRAGAYSNSY